jgi:hypothetical protein
MVIRGGEGWKKGRMEGSCMTGTKAQWGRRNSSVLQHGGVTIDLELGPPRADIPEESNAMHTEKYLFLLWPKIWE